MAFMIEKRTNIASSSTFIPSESDVLNKNHEALELQGLHVDFKDVLKMACFPPTRFALHHLRHTFAKLMLQQSTPIILDILFRQL